MSFVAAISEIKPEHEVMQTEIGLLPSEWQVVPIGDAVHLINGMAFKPTQWGDNGLPIIRIQNLNSTDAEFNYFRGVIDERLRIRTADLLFAWSGTKGTSFGARVWLGPEGVLNQHIFKVLPRENILTRQYAYWILREAQRAIENHAHGFKASFVHVKKSDLVSVKVAIPSSKREQQAIAEALSDADALIEGLYSLIVKKRAIKQGVMQELLTRKCRLPGFDGDWEKQPLGALADIRSGGTPSTVVSDFWNGDVLWCTPTDITALHGRKYLHSTARRITLAGLRSSAAELLPTGTIVMTSRATIGECAIASVPMATNQGFKNFIVNAGTNENFLFYLLTTQKEGFVALCGGSTFLEISKRQVENYRVFLPKEREEQTAIAAVLSDMDIEIEALEGKLTKARAVKQGMMQELLTGRVRLV